MVFLFWEAFFSFSSCASIFIASSSFTLSNVEDEYASITLNDEEADGLEFQCLKDGIGSSMNLQWIIVGQVLTAKQSMLLL